MADFRVVPYGFDNFAGVEALWREAFPDDPPWNRAEVVIPAKLAVQPELFLVALGDWFYYCWLRRASRLVLCGGCLIGAKASGPHLFVEQRTVFGRWGATKSTYRSGRQTPPLSISIGNSDNDRRAHEYGEAITVSIARK